MTKPLEKSDQELSEGVRQSDSACFKDLFHRYYKPLFLYFRQRVSSDDQAKDFIQDIFARLWQNRHNLNANLSIKSYLFRAAHNMLIDFYRRKSTRQQYLENKPDDPGVETPHEHFEVEESIQKALAELPENVRTVFLMNRFDNLKYSEIAETLDISVKTRL